jgi:glycosyltransferase involved in cell wall biosynthesis
VIRLLAYTESAVLGGAELALAYLVGALGPEFEIGVLATDRRVGEVIAAHRPGARVITVSAPRGALDRAALVAHVRAVRAFAPDVLHANQTWPWGCGYAEVAGLLTPPVRVVAVDHLPVAGAIQRRRILARRLLARRLHGHVSVGERASRLVETIVGLESDSVLAVPNGVPEVATPPPGRLDGGEPIIGSVGRLSEQKGYDQLVRALATLPAAKLVLVGDGPQREALEGQAAKLGVGDRLHITGWTEQPRLHLPRFDVFALPSHYEGMPLGILEAMHAGLPVVATDVGSVADAVADGTTGYVVPAGDSEGLRDRLAGLLADAALRRRMGEQGRLRARSEFTAEVMARRYEELYRGLLRPARWSRVPRVIAPRRTRSRSGG